jgi:hypothetical protein
MQPRVIQSGKFVMQVVSSRAMRLRVVGVTGVEPVTLRLSSACSNQLSYTPKRLCRNFKFPIQDLEFKAGGAEETRTPDL